MPSLSVTNLAITLTLTPTLTLTLTLLTLVYIRAYSRHQTALAATDFPTCSYGRPME